MSSEPVIVRLHPHARERLDERGATEVRADLVALDELGYLPFPLSGGQMLFHLVAQLEGRASVVRQTTRRRVLGDGDVPAGYTPRRKPARLTSRYTVEQG